MVLGDREEGEGHPRWKPQPRHTCRGKDAHGRSLGRRLCWGWRGRTGLNGAEQAEDARRGPGCGGRTTGWTCTQRAAGALEVPVAVEKDPSGSVAHAGRGRDGGREAREAPATARPLPSSFSPSRLLPSWPRNTRHVRSSLRTLAVCSLHQDRACSSHLPVPKHLLSKPPLPRSPCLPKAPNFGGDGILKLT